MTVRTILVAHDGSDDAAHALEWATDLARQTNAGLVVVHAWSPLDDLDRHHDRANFAELRDEALADLRDNWCRDAIAAGVSVDARLVEDRPVPGIVRAARDAGADLIVCGTRGRGRVSGFVLGRVARALPEQSHLPVVTVPPA